MVKIHSLLQEGHVNEGGDHEGVEPEVVTTDAAVDSIEEDSPESLFGPEVQLKLKEEAEEKSNDRRRR